MSAESEVPRSGVFDSFGRILGKMTAILQNRAELFVVELQEEKHRLVALFLLAGTALLLELLALILFSGVIIFLFPAPYRLYVAASLGVLYLAAGFFILHRVKSQLHPEPFGETINQIKKDVACLTPHT